MFRSEGRGSWNNYNSTAGNHRLQPIPGGLFRPSDLKTEIERLGIQVNFIEPNPLQPYTLTK